jgi:hypothetical protein
MIWNGYEVWNDKVKEDEMGIACSIDGEEMNAYTVLVGNPEGNRPLGRPRHGWENNIKLILQK